MTPDQLRLAVLLATGEVLTPGAAERLARVLENDEEVLPFLVLKVGGFAASEPIQDALAALGRLAQAPRTAREPARGNLAAASSASSEVMARQRQMIEADLANRSCQDDYAWALRHLQRVTEQPQRLAFTACVRPA